MKRLYLFVISATVFTVLLLVSLFVASCNKQTDPSVSGIIGTWTNEGTGDYDDVVQTILTINEDGTMIINSFSAIDAPDESDNGISAVWKAEGDNLKIGIPGIEAESEMDEDDYESCKFKVENDCLLLCADGIWYLYTKTN